MPALSRRRFLMISAAACSGLAVGNTARAEPLTQWRGVALGAEATILLRHQDAARIIATARAEIERLEKIFSLHRGDSALVRLNNSGHLSGPPFELLELLGLCGTIHTATAGLFEPTIQPLWVTYAEHYATAHTPSEAAIRRALDRVGWPGVSLSTNLISFARPGMALTLNGIAQGYIADRVVALLRAEGLSDVLVNTGELRALGGHPDGGGWPVSLNDGKHRQKAVTNLRDMALASSAPLGTAFDAAGRVGHILHPITGQPAEINWRLISLTGPSAALVDALSTAMCLMTRAEINSVLETFPDVRVAYLG